MATAIRKHLRDFIAVAVLLVVALLVTWYIVQEQRLRVPVLEEKPFELKDMFFDMDPGTESAGEVEDGETLSVANTAPDVNLDQILEALDADTQAYLRLLITGAGKGLEGRGRAPGGVPGPRGPPTRAPNRLNSKVAQ